MVPLTTGIQPKPSAPAPPITVACSGCGGKLKVRAELAGKKAKCPKCSSVTRVPVPAPPPAPEEDVIMAEPDDATYVEAEPDEPRVSFFSRLVVVAAMFVIILTVIGCSIYANLSFTVTKSVNFKYFPPFMAHHNGNMNRHLGAEYHEIAKAIVAGEGFANPFKEKTGPTAWMPPLLPALTAALMLICDDRDSVMTVILFFQGATLILTGLIVLILARQTTTWLGLLSNLPPFLQGLANLGWTFWIVAAFMIGLLCDFRMWFQVTHDCWFILLALDLAVIGYSWCKPMQGWKSSVGWGLFGGFCAMTSPIVGLVWGMLTLALLARERAWIRFGIMCVFAGLTVTPWIVRNYIVFGRFIPIKSNAAYELYQSQCLIPDGLLQPNAFGSHPYGNAGRERRLYKELGELPFLDKKRELFWESVNKDPVDFLDRAACRFLGATLWYIPFNRDEIRNRRTFVWINRAIHPWPFVALLFLAATAVWQRLSPAQWGVMIVYVFYLSPYIAISYYERYAIPLLGVKVLLVIWALDRLLWLVISLIKWIIGPKYS